MGLSKNLIVVGAGASMKYGLPSGLQLRDRILESTIRDGDIQNLVRYIHRDDLRELSPRHSEVFVSDRVNYLGESLRGDLEKFKKSFRLSSLSSIDAFLSKKFDLEKDRNLPLLGKYLIVREIINKQSESLNNKNIGWIHYLISNYIDTSYQDFFKHAPRIITFNYDTLIETHIRNYLIHKQNLSIKESEDLVESLGIVHVYGKISSHDNNTVTPEDIDGIEIMNGERKSNHPLIKQYIDDSSYSGRIYILGFSYDRINCDLLFSDTKSSSSKRIIYSTFYDQYLEEIKYGLSNSVPSVELIGEENFSYGVRFSVEDIFRKHPLIRG